MEEEGGRSNHRGRGRSFSRGGCNRSLENVVGRGKNQNFSHPSGWIFYKYQIQCHYCKKFGHYAYECRKKQYDIGKQS